MSRISGDIYKLENGYLVEIPQSEKPPKGSKLWYGYDYEKQHWTYEGSRDTRTLEEIKKAIKN